MVGVEIVVEFEIVGVELKELGVESVKVGEEGFAFMGVRLHSKWLVSNMSVVDAGGDGAGFVHKVLSPSLFKFWSLGVVVVGVRLVYVE